MQNIKYLTHLSIKVLSLSSLMLIQRYGPYPRKSIEPILGALIEEKCIQHKRNPRTIFAEKNKAEIELMCFRRFVRNRFAEIAGGFLYSIIISIPGVSVIYQGQIGRPVKEKGTGDRIALSPDPTVVM